ncbi:MAG: CAAX prenyl protease-related protein [Verrucomicrobiales bacterium]|nr:CAAX prenyl protease-related protein [Verrucomicrobiales bacterium]
MKAASTSPLAGLRRSRLAALVVPFGFFMVSLQLIQWIRTEGEGLPWWQSHPEHWGYPLQAVICIAMVIWWRRTYPPFSRRGIGLGIIMGALGIGIWLLPPAIHHLTGLGSTDLLPWLSYLGFQPRLEGFNPYAFGAGQSALLLWTIIGMRFLRLVVAVSLVEEIFWRGFLMRWLIPAKEGWLNLSIGTYDKQAFWFTSIAFALVHAGPDLFVALIFGMLAGWVTIRTKNLWAVVMMHATANLLLGIFIMLTKWWGLW